MYKPQSILNLQSLLDLEMHLGLKRYGRFDIENTYNLDRNDNVTHLMITTNKNIDISFLEWFPHLQGLNLQAAHISGMDTFAKVTSLEKLSLSSPKLSNLQALKLLPGLRELDLFSEHPIDLERLQMLKELKKLHLNRCKITDISFLHALPQLQHLVLQHTYFKDATPLKYLKSLRYLNCVGNKEPDFSILSSCYKLEHLLLADTELSDISFVSHLVNLKSLVAAGNNIFSIAPLQNLPRLTLLNLSNNKISDLTPLSRLRLTDLDISFNEVRDISPILKIRTLREVKLTGNKSLETDFPQSVLSAGWQSIKQFSQESRKARLFRNLKVLLLGNPNIGKTTLLTYLESNRLGKPLRSTHGVTYTRLKLNDSIFHIWDFGGQEYFHATHKLFFSPDALNVVVWGKDIEREPGDNISFFDLEYWLRTIEQLNYSTKWKEEVLILENKIDLNPEKRETNLDFASIEKKFDKLRISSSGISLAENLRLELFKVQFFEIATRIIDKFEYPAFYEVFLKRIEERNKDYVTISEINNRPEKENVLAALKVFHNMGILLYFHHTLPDKVFVKPEVLLNLLYEKVLGEERADRLSLSTITNAIIGNSLDLSADEVVSLLLRFNLVFETDEKHVYFVPQYLKALTPLAETLIKKNFVKSNIAIIGDSYLMNVAMLKIYSSFGRFVKGRDTKEYMFWKDGIIIEAEGLLALVEFDRPRQIIRFYEDNHSDNFFLQKEIVDFVLDLPECGELPKRNFKNHVKKRYKDTLEEDHERFSPFIMETLTETNEEFFNSFMSDDYSKLVNWDSLYMTISVSIDGQHFVNWQDLNNAKEIGKVKATDSQGSHIINNVAEYAKYINIDPQMDDENQRQKPQESSTNFNFYGDVQANVIGNGNTVNMEKTVPGYTTTQTKEKADATINAPSANPKPSGLTKEERLGVKKWKITGLLWFGVSLCITAFLVWAYVTVPSFVNATDLEKFKKSDWSKWSGIVIGIVWNSFLGKIAYDRLFDPSKENSFIDLFRKKNKI